MVKGDKQSILREFPSVHQLLDMPAVQRFIEEHGRRLVVDTLRKTMEDMKASLLQEDEDAALFQAVSRERLTEVVLKKLGDRIKIHKRPNLRKVVNATGVVLHTNLGRAPLPHEAVQSVQKVAESYSNLEYSLEEGTRGSRQDAVRDLLIELTGAEDALVVNNNAAAVFLTLNTLGYGREVLVSRGEQVEIGGSFRIPDIIRRSGARMVEVGTTNKTRLLDYEDAITEDTGILMKVHTSNFKIVGFTESVELSELAVLGRKRSIAVVDDLGSGSLIDLSLYGFPYEPTVADSLKAGAQLVLFSGDKLLGGPQAGLVVGERALVQQIRRNPLARMVRIDKMTLAALEAVLRLYRDSDDVVRVLPVHQMLTTAGEHLQASAERLKENLAESLSSKCQIHIIDVLDEPGGGAMPGVELRGKAVALTARDVPAQDLLAACRQWEVPIVARVQNDSLIFSVRTLLEEDYDIISACMRKFFLNHE